MESVVAPDNARAAYLKVKANRGAPGVDGLGTDEMAGHLREHWETIRKRLLEGKYVPFAVRAVDIPKASGGTRRLGIPTVIDRMIQQALAQELEGVFDPGFSDHSYGFRPGRSAHQAVRAARGYVQEGKNWVVDIDLKNFFDQVNHDRLMGMVGRKVRDKRVLSLIGAYLRAPMRLEDGTRQKRLVGTPQGGPLSPLLANIYLDPLDKELEKRGIAFVRYADDVAIYAGSPQAAERILGSIIKWLKKELGLEVNLEKSGTGPTDGTSLLGFTVRQTGQIIIAPKSITRFKERARQLWDARQSLTERQLCQNWQNYSRGWWNYFQVAERHWEVRDLTGWLRRHMRKCLWLRWHNPAGRLAALKRLGVNHRARGIAYTGLGAWAVAKSRPLHQALNNLTLHQMGYLIPWDQTFAPKAKALA